MNSSAAIAVDVTNDLNRPVEVTDSYEVRWGFQISQRDKPLNARECGLSKAPFAKFFPIKSFETPQENHTVDEYKPRENVIIMPAGRVEASLMASLGGQGAQSQADWGLVTAFINETDAAKMAVISETLLPSLSRIREICDELNTQVISEVCEGSDDLDFGQRESCVSCYWKWLNSPVLAQHMENMAITGINVVERDTTTGEITERLVRPSIADLRMARDIALESGRRGVTQLEAIWRDIAGEYEKADGIRKDISEFEHGYRKDLHQSRPQDRQFALAREIARSTPAGTDGAMLNRLAEATIGLAEGQKQTNVLLNKLVAEKESGVNLADTSEVPVSKAPLSTLTEPDAINSDADLAPGAKAMEAKKNKGDK